ncbi:MAG TPA: DUF2889 domain-containing protein [Acidimicrobiales bacterium]|nr:DUF2889 domain-containing protein [Acidimicrobiales bacterium]
MTTGPRVPAGPHRPADRTPARVPGSIRRTTTVDAWWPAGPDGTLRLAGAGRDLLTPGDGSAAEPVVLASEAVTAEVDRERRAVLALDAALPDGALRGLRGQSLRGAFRLALSAADLGGGRDPAAANLVYALLDELPAVSLVSGYHLLRLAGPDGPTRHVDVGSMAGVCAGWAPGSSMLQAAVADGRAPMILGPAAPDLSRVGDRWAWHHLPARRPGTVRRRRRTDLGPAGGDRWAVDAMFRDTYTEPDGSETVVHEYAVTAAVDRGRLVAVDADPRVLPASECPSAAASAGALVGASLVDLRLRVRRDLRGTGTCTHLNDLLRTFADLPDLIAAADRLSGNPSARTGRAGPDGGRAGPAGPDGDRAATARRAG